MNKLAITNCRIYTGDGVHEDGCILMDGGKIISLLSEPLPGVENIDLAGWNIAPGFIDIQINGGEELYFSDNLTPEGLDDLCASSLKYGATHVLPCLISSPKEKIVEAIRLIKNYRLSHPQVVGLHLEGPFINPEKRGAHSAEIIRKPSNEELAQIIEEGRDTIKLMTIAPEQFTDEQLKMLLDSGIMLSIGHSNIGYEQAKHYFSKGITIVTHLFNAMTQFLHREPGLVGAALETEEVFTPVILDGAHCHYASAKIAYAVKKDKMILLSDAAFLGRKKQSFQSGLINGRLVDGFYRNEDGNLAGAAISMQEAVVNAEKYVGIPREAALKMASSGVATALKMEKELGKVAPGYPASFVCFKDDWSAFKTLQF